MNDGNKAKYVEMSILCDRILLMMDEARSPYVQTMELVKEAKKYVLIQPEKSVKIMRKAFSEIEKEYNLVSEFDKLVSAFPTNKRLDPNSEIGTAEKSFKDAIRNGKFRDAEKQLKEVRVLMGNGSYSKSLTVSAVDNKVVDGKTELIVTNTSEKDLIINKTEVASFDAVTAKVLLPNKVLKAKSQMKMPLEFSDIRKGTSLVTVTVWYESDFEEYEESLSMKVFNEGAKE